MIHFTGVRHVRSVQYILVWFLLSMLIGVIQVSSIAEAGTVPQDDSNVYRTVTVRDKGAGFFIENRGQWRNGASMIAETSFGHIGLLSSKLYFDIDDADRNGGSVIGYEMIGGRSVRPVGSEMMSHPTNFFLGDDPEAWVADARSYRAAVYEEVWEGIDIIYRFDGNVVKYDIVIEPGSDPGKIRSKVSGQSFLDARGDELIIGLPDGRVLLDSGLKVFYMDDPEVAIPARFCLMDEDTFGFSLGSYDRSRSIVIDPQLVYSTFVGGSGMEDGGRSVIDDDGNVYVCTQTYSMDFPTVPGSYGSYDYADMAIFKMDPTLSALKYCAFFGGSETETFGGIAMNEAGEVFVTGTTRSADMPTTDGAYDRNLSKDFYYGLRSDIFVMGLNSTGTGLLFSTYVGVEDVETANDILLDTSGNLIVLGTSPSDEFTVTYDAYDGNYNGGRWDTVLFEMDGNCSSLLYSTFIGGSGWETPVRMVLEGDDLLYILGNTNSSDFPATSGSFDTSYDKDRQDTNPFVMVFNLTSNTVENSTFLDPSIAYGMALDDDGGVFICGSTTNASFSTTEGAVQTGFMGRIDGFLLKMDRRLNGLDYSTFVGGSDYDICYEVSVNSSGCAFIGGTTSSSDFPVKEGAFDDKLNNTTKLFLATLEPDGSDYIYSTFIGGNKGQMLRTINIIGEHHAYISGYSGSPGYPTTTGCFSNTMKGVYDVVISRFNCTRFYNPPYPPGNLTGRIAGSKAILEWDAPLKDGGKPVLGYEIYRETSTNRSELIATTSDPSFTDPISDLETLYYYQVSAYNEIGNSTRTRKIALREVDPPDLIEDKTPSNLLPGSELAFFAVIRDNVSIAVAEISYSIDGGPTVSLPFIREGDDGYRNSIWLPDRELDVDYTFIAVDFWGNSMEMSMKRVSVRGEYLPVIDISSIPQTVQAGAVLDIAVGITDDWGVENAYFVYATGNGHPRNVSLSRIDGDVYGYCMDVGGLPGEGIRYSVLAEDVHGNWNGTGASVIAIGDGIPPAFVQDRTIGQCTTGDPLHFRVEIEEMFDMDSVNAIYRYGSGPPNTASMTRTSGSIWSAMIVVGHTIDPISYHFEAIDGAGNLNVSEERTCIVIDDDRPVISDIVSPGEAFTGKDLRVECSVSDNIGLSRVTLVFWTKNDRGHSLAMENLDDDFIADLPVPIDSMDRIEFAIEAKDTSDNRIRSEVRTVIVADDISPSIMPIPDLGTYVGEGLEIRISASDNIRLGSVTWNGPPASVTGDVWTAMFQDAGVHPITVTATDLSGNIGTMEFNVTVLPTDHDGDVDGIPDLVEIGLGLSPDDPADAQLDMDSDGISNSEEYRLGTSLILEDTDLDGMPDGWEVLHGLDPLVHNGLKDTDGDGHSDLEEFISGTDPTVPDPVDDESGRGRAIDTIDVVLIASISVALSVIIFLVIRRYREAS